MTTSNTMNFRQTALAATLGVALLVIGLSACQPPAAEPEQNTLTEEQQAEGWELLFDGQDMSAWRGFQRQDVPSKWSVDDGAIYFGPGDGDGGDIITVEQYQDFEMELEWMIGECGNSGIFFHVAEADYDRTFFTGPEVQVLDNACHPDALNGPDRFAGANYALHPPTPFCVANPAGQWNHVRLVVNGPHVEHWMNGRKVVEYELWSDDWNQRVAASKFIEMPGYGQMRSGHIALQDHGDPVWFRNIKIRRLNGERPV
jgi:hypothetical protein